MNRTPMFDLYLTALVFVVLCLLVSESQPQPAFAYSVVPTYTVINTFADEPVSFLSPVPASVAEESAIAESHTTASNIEAPVIDQALTKDTQAKTEQLLATMTKKELLQLIQSNGWYVKAVTSLNKRQLAEAAAERI